MSQDRPVYKFLYPYIPKVSGAYGKLIGMLFTTGGFFELDPKKVTDEVIERICKGVLGKADEVFKSHGECVYEIIPAGLRLDPSIEADKKTLDNLGAEECLDLFERILEVNSGFFMKLLRSIFDAVSSLSSKRPKQT